MDLTIHQEHGHLQASLAGKFVFSDNATYKTLLDAVAANAPKQITVDLSKLDYVDSAALGMLLLLKDSASACNAKVTMKSPKGQVEKLLKLSRFEQVFQIAA